jgi:hypothetical protein
MNQQWALWAGQKNKIKCYFQHYNILSAHEVIYGILTSRTYVSLVFYHKVRSGKIIVEKVLQAILLEWGTSDWFYTK